ncbi:methyl-accepting chemotaxis protein, partial [Aduncisulcus paluster]
MGYLQVSSIKDEAQNAILKKSRAIVQLAEASREQMNHKLNEGILMPFDKIPPEKVLEAVPVISAINVV